jgi:hypothetical protein
VHHVERIEEVVEVSDCKFARFKFVELAKSHKHPNTSDHLVQQKPKEDVVEDLLRSFNKVE